MNRCGCIQSEQRNPKGILRDGMSGRDLGAGAAALSAEICGHSGCGGSFSERVARATPVRLGSRGLAKLSRIPKRITAQFEVNLNRAGPVKATDF
jgi:hypothetical protein